MTKASHLEKNMEIYQWQPDTLTCQQWVKINKPHAPNQSDTTTQPNLIKNILRPGVKALNKSTGKRTSSIIEKGSMLIFYINIHDNRQKLLPCSVFTHSMIRTYHKYCSNKMCTENPNQTSMIRTFVQENFSQSKTNSCQDGNRLHSKKVPLQSF